MDISKCRLELKHLLEEEKKVIELCMRTKFMLKGTVYQMKVKCGKKGCKCEKEGELHTAWRITRSYKGKPQARCLSGEEVLKYKRLTQNYRKFRQARARLVKIHQEQLKLIDFLEKEGRKKDLELKIYRKNIV